jgi:hypothetical protein
MGEKGARGAENSCVKLSLWPPVLRAIRVPGQARGCRAGKRLRRGAEIKRLYWGELCLEDGGNLF